MESQQDFVDAGISQFRFILFPPFPQMRFRIHILLYMQEKVGKKKGNILALNQ